MVLTPTRRARLQSTLAALGTLLLWWHTGTRAAAILATTAATLTLLAWLTPRLYAPVHQFLERVRHALLAGLTWIVLALLFVVLIIPIRLWRYITGTDPLHLQPDPDAKTFLEPLPPPRSDRFDRQF